MNNKKYFFVQSGVFAFIALLIIGGAVGGDVLLKKQADKLNKLKVESKVIEMQQTALIQAKNDVQKYKELDQIARSVVPQDKDQAKTVREIVQIAGENSIPIKSVTFENSNLGNPAAGASGSAAAQQSAISQVKPVQGINGVYTLQIQVGSAGEVGYENFLGFLEDLEKSRRTAHVTAISIDPNDAGTRLNFNLTLNAYVKP